MGNCRLPTSKVDAAEDRSPPLSARLEEAVHPVDADRDVVARPYRLEIAGEVLLEGERRQPVDLVGAERRPEDELQVFSGPLPFTHEHAPAEAGEAAYAMPGLVCRPPPHVGDNGPKDQQLSRVSNLHYRSSSCTRAATRKGRVRR